MSFLPNYYFDLNLINIVFLQGYEIFESFQKKYIFKTIKKLILFIINSIIKPYIFMVIYSFGFL